MRASVVTDAIERFTEKGLMYSGVPKLARFPKQGSRPPWKLHQNDARDILTLRYGRIAGAAMAFS